MKPPIEEEGKKGARGGEASSSLVFSRGGGSDLRYSASGQSNDATF